MEKIIFMKNRILNKFVGILLGFIKPIYYFFYNYYLLYKRKKVVSDAASILIKSSSKKYYDNEEIFNKLQNDYEGVPEYGYDSLSTWKRGNERAFELLALNDLNVVPKNILEAGCGDGMTAYALSCYGHNVTLLDQDDWRESRAKKLNFKKVDLDKPLNFDDAAFDLVYSFNTFEHLPNPDATLSELMRVCKQGGYVFLEFGPLYASPWGLHAYRMFRMPYPQYLFSADFISSKLKVMGVNDLGQIRTDLQYVNKWLFTEYKSLFDKYKINIVRFDIGKNEEYLDMICKYPDAFVGQNITLSDLTVGNIRVILKK